MNLKSINLSILSSVLFMSIMTSAQVTIDEKDNLLKESEFSPEILAATKVTKDGRVKIDGVAAVVGDYLILESDISKAYLDMRNQQIGEITYCDVAETIMENKLFAHHAKLDSLPFNPERVASFTDQQINQFVSQVGSMDKLLSFYKIDTEDELREQLNEINTQRMLAEEMQGAIVDEVEITPEETRDFFESIPEDEIPLINDEVELAQIIVKPEVGEKERQAVVDKLNSFRDDVLAGGSFATKAVLYSEDRGSRSSGGKITLTREDPYVKEFKDAAFSLREGEISKPFETEFGWHILTVDKIRGQQVDVRHILLYPEISSEAIEKARKEIEIVREKIVNGEVSFKDAAREVSDEKETKESGGQLINSATGDRRFELTKIDPAIYGQVVDLKENEVSPVIKDTEPRTAKVFFKVITVTKKIPEHVAEFSKDYTRIRELALQQKKLKEINAWKAENAEDTYIKVNGDYKACEFAKSWIKQ
ncbi:peptidylprolyl isomerase [Psychroflexus sediminis]|uniref:Periplasmic chaperone for outer membrane proteins SurA n=1 Tax=Psychroflexus sediminis TaxID=470826 RepID=A0A1G7WEF1_9FLAO|nr:peptidylprolyl isomerase [Psychroflexus sediminis]SDG70318.1 periplasmic chaperone for outer membrane proteins SurA [Psychroflexus sediminis]